MAIPPSAGPDEPSHMVRGAALVRGLEFVPPEVTHRLAYELPGWVGFPPPGCFGQQPYTPATCATTLPRPGGETVLVESRSTEYPVWGHLLPGLGTLFPAEAANWAARGLGAIPAVVLLGLALYVRARRGWLAAGSAVLAVTPMAWFSVAVVNPSGLVIAGAVALWVGLDALKEPNAIHRWLVALGFAALVLPRRDGFIWAMFILSIVLLVNNDGLRQTWRRLGWGPQILVAVSAGLTWVWAGRSDTTFAAALFVVPAIPLIAVVSRRLWRSPFLTGSIRKAGAASVAVGIGVVLSYVAMDRRPTGYDGNVLLIMIGRTGLHLREAIGVLGWLDTPLPETMTMLWILALGVLVAGAFIVDERKLLFGAVGTLGAAIASSWVLGMIQGDPTGTNWQGRYYLPLLAGVPLLLGQATPVATVRRLGKPVLVMALVVLNVALAAAMRRWGVGIAGSLSPFAWNTYNTPLPPALLLAGHVVASVGLWFQLARTVDGSTWLAESEVAPQPDDRLDGAALQR